jgi:hypothetical protein
MLVNSDGALHDSMSYHTDALTHFGLRFKDPSHERRFMQSGRVPAADVAETVFSAVSDGQLGGKGGTGLALARARHVLKLHSDSRMHVRSDGPSRGTAVCFTLNLKLADATSARLSLRAAEVRQQETGQAPPNDKQSAAAALSAEPPMALAAPAALLSSSLSPTCRR